MLSARSDACFRSGTRAYRDFTYLLRLMFLVTIPSVVPHLDGSLRTMAPAAACSWGKGGGIGTNLAAESGGHCFEAADPFFEWWMRAEQVRERLAREWIDDVEMSERGLGGLRWHYLRCPLELAQRGRQPSDRLRPPL